MEVAVETRSRPEPETALAAVPEEPARGPAATEAPGERARDPHGRDAAVEKRRWLAVAGFLGLLVLTFATITDRRLLLFTVSVLLVLMGLTLFRRQAEDVPAPWHRPADLAALPAAQAVALGAAEDAGPESHPKPAAQ